MSPEEPAECPDPPDGARIEEVSEGQCELSKTLFMARSAQRGDPSAWEVLDRRCRRWIGQRLRRVKLPPGTEVDDVVQYVLQDVFTGFNRFEVKPGARFWAWLACIVDNNLRDIYRRYAAKKRGAGREVLMQDLTGSRDLGLASTEPNQTAMVRFREAETKYRAVLDKLPENYRTVLYLRDLEGLDYREIVAELGAKNVESVRLTCHRARIKARRMMREFEDSEFGSP